MLTLGRLTRIGIVGLMTVLSAALAEASVLGLEAGTGPPLRVRVFATDGFTEAVPINSVDTSKIPLGGFANTTQSGVLQPVLQLNSFGLVWQDFDYHGTLGVAAIPIALHISQLSVEYSNSLGVMNSVPLLLGANTVMVQTNQIHGSLAGQLTVGADIFPFSIPLSNEADSVEVTNLNALDFDRLQFSSSSNNHPVGLPFRTLIAQSGGVDFSLALGADFDRGATFDAAATPVPEPSAIMLVGLGLTALAIARRARGHSLRQ